jgi:hypothetical protein
VSKFASLRKWLSFLLLSALVLAMSLGIHNWYTLPHKFAWLN